MVYVRHVSASGGVGNWWRYDTVRKTVFLVFAAGTVAVDVCAISHPRFGAFPIVRLDSCTWRIEPARYTLRTSVGEITTQYCSLHERLGSESVALLDAPDSVAVELADLGRI